MRLARDYQAPIPQSLDEALTTLGSQHWRAAGDEGPLTLPGGDLYPYQAAGVRWLEAAGGRGLIADQMGLGKTVQALAALSRRPQGYPALVVCPAGLRVNWAKAVCDWLDLEPSDVGLYGVGRTGPYASVFGDLRAGVPPVLICSYAMLSGLVKSRSSDPGVAPPSRKPWGALIFDESHRLKNSRSARSRAAQKLVRRAPHALVLLLSGTPMPTHPADLWHQLNLLDPGAFPSYVNFTGRWCGGWEAPWGWSLGNPSEKMGLDLFRHLQDRWVLRREKRSVLPELPPKRRFLVYADFMRGASAKEYGAVTKDASTLRGEAGEAEGEDRASLLGQALGRIDRLRCLAGLHKCALLPDLHQGEPWLVFAWHREVQRKAFEVLKEAGLRVSSIRADLAPLERQARVDSFQRGEFDVLVCSIGAASEGLTLTRSTRTVFVQRSYSPSVLEQCEDRVHRIGQTGQCEAIYLHLSASIDDGVQKVVERKRRNESLVLDGRPLRGSQHEGLLAFDLSSSSEPGTST